MIKQRTLKNAVRAVGVCMHNGGRSAIVMRPAQPDTGIVFRRVDVTPAEVIAAKALNVHDSELCTTIMAGKKSVSTIEHIMSALAGLGIDNAYIDIDSDEVPIMDGSAGPFIFLIQSAGIEEQNSPKKFIKIKREVFVEELGKHARLIPYDGLKASFSIEFDHPLFNAKNSSVEIDFSTSSYTQEISRARTFGFTRDIAYLRKKNLALGGNLDNAVVIDEYNVINKEGLRMHDECVRHKLLDAIGDLYLLGHSIIGAFYGHKSGHALNNKIARAVLSDDACYEIVTFEQNEKTQKYAPAMPILQEV